MPPLQAQRIAKKKGLNMNQWQSIEQTLPKVTGKRSEETICYIRKINKIKGVIYKSVWKETYIQGGQFPGGK